MFENRQILRPKDRKLKGRLCCISYLLDILNKRGLIVLLFGRVFGDTSKQVNYKVPRFCIY